MFEPIQHSAFQALDAPDVIGRGVLRCPVTIHVTRLPGQEPSDPVELMEYTHVFIEPPAIHVIEYIALLVKSAQASMKAPKIELGLDSDGILEGFAASLDSAVSRTKTDAAVIMHILRSDDRAFCEAIPSTQVDLLIAGYESTAPALEDMKKKLLEMQEMAYQAAVKAAVSRIEQAHGQGAPAA